MTAWVDEAVNGVERTAAPAVGTAGSAPAPPVRTAAARRRVSRRSLVLSVLIVLLGGLLAFTAGQMLTAHDEVLAVARDVAVGSTITADDLTTASVPADPNLRPIPAGQLAEVVGLVAQVPLSRGGLLTRAQVGAGTGLGTGELLVALPLQDGQFPARGLAPGQPILIVPTPGQAAPTADGGSGAAPARSIDAIVAEVGETNPTTQLTVVDARLPAADGPTVARLASTGNLAVVLLPEGR